MRKLILFGIVFVLLAVNINAQNIVNGKLIELGSNLEEIPVVGARIEAFGGDFGVVSQIKFSDGQGNFQLTYAGSSGFADNFGGTVIITKDGYFETLINNFLEVYSDNPEILMKKISQPSIPTRPSVPIDLQKYVDNEINDFDNVRVRRNFLDDNFRYDDTKIAYSGSIEYYHASIVSNLDLRITDKFGNTFPSFTNIKSGSTVEFWKSGRKIKEKVLYYDASKTLRQDCTYFIFKNKDNFMAHFDICRPGASAGIAIYGPLSRENVKTGEFVSLDGNAVPTDLNKLDCVDSLEVAPSILPPAGFALKGENWCNDKNGFAENSHCSNGRCVSDKFLSIEELLNQVRLLIKENKYDDAINLANSFLEKFSGVDKDRLSFELGTAYSFKAVNRIDGTGKIDPDVKSNLNLAKNIFSVLSSKYSNFIGPLSPESYEYKLMFQSNLNIKNIDEIADIYLLPVDKAMKHAVEEKAIRELSSDAPKNIIDVLSATLNEGGNPITLFRNAFKSACPTCFGDVLDSKYNRLTKIHTASLVLRRELLCGAESIAQAYYKLEKERLNYQLTYQNSINTPASEEDYKNRLRKHFFSGQNLGNQQSLGSQFCLSGADSNSYKREGGDYYDPDVADYLVPTGSTADLGYVILLGTDQQDYVSVDINHVLDALNPENNPAIKMAIEKEILAEKGVLTQEQNDMLLFNLACDYRNLRLPGTAKIVLQSLANRNVQLKHSCSFFESAKTPQEMITQNIEGGGDGWASYFDLNIADDTWNSVISIDTAESFFNLGYMGTARLVTSGLRKVPGILIKKGISPGFIATGGKTVSAVYNAIRSSVLSTLRLNGGNGILFRSGKFFVKIGEEGLEEFGQEWISALVQAGTNNPLIASLAEMIAGSKGIVDISARIDIMHNLNYQFARSTIDPTINPSLKGKVGYNLQGLNVGWREGGRATILEVNSGGITVVLDSGKQVTIRTLDELGSKINFIKPGGEFITIADVRKDFAGTEVGNRNLNDELQGWIDFVDNDLTIDSSIVADVESLESVFAGITDPAIKNSLEQGLLESLHDENGQFDAESFEGHALESATLGFENEPVNIINPVKLEGFLSSEISAGQRGSIDNIRCNSPCTIPIRAQDGKSGTAAHTQLGNLVLVDPEKQILIQNVRDRVAETEPDIETLLLSIDMIANTYSGVDYLYYLNEDHTKSLLYLKFNDVWFRDETYNILIYDEPTIQNIIDARLSRGTGVGIAAEIDAILPRLLDKLISVPIVPELQKTYYHKQLNSYFKYQGLANGRHEFLNIKTREKISTDGVGLSKFMDFIGSDAEAEILNVEKEYLNKDYVIHGVHFAKLIEILRKGEIPTTISEGETKPYVYFAEGTGPYGLSQEITNDIPILTTTAFKISNGHSGLVVQNHDEMPGAILVFDKTLISGQKTRNSYGVDELPYEKSNGFRAFLDPIPIDRSLVKIITTSRNFEILKELFKKIDTGKLNALFGGPGSDRNWQVVITAPNQELNVFPDVNVDIDRRILQFKSIIEDAKKIGNEEAQNIFAYKQLAGQLNVVVELQNELSNLDKFDYFSTLGLVAKRIAENSPSLGDSMIGPSLFSYRKAMLVSEGLENTDIYNKAKEDYI
ncbi:hypothetical protein HYT56_05340, partial [Candidatus Woesearchaeota archaeon]|nr:hypothetical protein [Candidatus Woesearchaeota archaeon]